MGKDVVDEIDRLVDESLSRPIVDDYNSDRYDKCFHCHRNWHGLAVTEQIARMYGRGVFDESYVAAEDDSKILCPGSDFIGPVAAQPTWRANAWSELMPGWIDEWPAFRWGRMTTGQRRWWRTQLPSDAQIELRHEPNRVILEIGDDSASFDAGDVHFEYEYDDEVMIHQSTHPAARTTMDVLADNAPGIGGTWTPLTAPGVTGHPADLSAPPYAGQIQRFTYTLADVEDLRAAAWRVDDAVATIAETVPDWSWDEPRPTRAEILEARQQANTAREQRLERFRARPEDAR